MNEELTEDQKELIRKSFKDNPSLEALIAIVFGEGIDSRTKQGRAVRNFLVEEGCKYSTKKTKHSERVIFNEEQKAIIHELLAEGKNSLEIAAKVFKKDKISKSSVEQRAVLSYISNYSGDIQATKTTGGPLPKYNPPRSGAFIVAQVNVASGENLDYQKLTRGEQLCLDRLLINMKNSRFVAMANSYDKADDRSLFEHEFVRLTWQKPDLTPDEVNLYMTMCRDIVSLETINRHLRRLNREFDECEDKTEMLTKLSDMIKAKSTEFNTTKSSIESMMKKLQGDRANRLDKQKSKTANFLSIVRAFQEENTRREMIQMADLQREAVLEEANKIASMSDFKARVLGFDMETLI